MRNTLVVLSWLATVILGSFVFSILVTIFESKLSFESIFGVLILGSIFSTAFSIPAVIIFVIFNNQYKKKYSDQKLYKKKMMLLHLTVGAIYFFSSLFVILFFETDKDLLRLLFGLLFSYLPVGMIIWYRLLSESKSISYEDIIDDSEI